MNTLPVKWVPPLMLLQNKITKTPISGRPIETIPVVRLSDLDVLREGLREINAKSVIPVAIAPELATTACGEINELAQRLLAMLPPASDTTNAPRSRIAQQLRERSGYGVYDCLEALARCGGDVERAAEYLRTKRFAVRIATPREPSVPYPEWCRHKEQCAGRVNCPDDPTCAD
mgnify:CR=1 FL=1